MRIYYLFPIIWLLAVGRGTAQTEAAKAPPFAGWISGGGGIYIHGFTSNGSGYGGEANLAYRRLLLTGRTIHFTGFSNWEYDPVSVFSTSPQDFSDLSVTASYLYRDKTNKVLLSAGGGLSFLTNERSQERTGDTERKKVTGLALEAQFNYFFVPYFGLGSSIFGSINGELDYGGVLLHVNVGVVPRPKRKG